MSAQAGAYMCASCGEPLASGARWCPSCHSTSVFFIASHDGALEVRDWKPAERPPESRWRPGVVTFGPTGRILLTVATAAPMVLAWLLIAGALGAVWATCFALGLFGAWLLAARVILRDVWHKDQIFEERLPLRASFRELRGS